MFGRRDTNAPPKKPQTPATPPVPEQKAVVAPSTPSQSMPAPAQPPAATTPTLATQKAEARLKAQETSETPSAPVAAPNTSLDDAKSRLYDLLMEQIDIGTASRLPRDELKQQILDLIGELVVEQRLPVTQTEQMMLGNQIIDDMLGFGPLEPLLKDPTVTDIMVNGPHQVYVEAKGKLRLTDVHFRDEEHVMSIATRIVTGVGRRVDESSPICDARLPDGSRVNVIAPPLSLKGTSISIRKFSEKKITLDVMAKQKNVSDKLCKLLKIAAACRLNIIISGGTGSGKTTLLNALSQMIDHGERVVTIEDAAELQLQQPHVVPLETRPANLEGTGEISMRDLVKNALRMRPDRIILGEVRGAEALDLLQAMNTGHDGSMGTLHANNPREALTRLENMVGMGASNLPSKALRTQISSAVNMIVQISRMRDGMRRITHVSEIVGMEGDVIVTQDLYHFEYQGEDEHGILIGDFVSTGLRPHFTQRAAYFGLEQALLETI
jgi:pilus assembly protein CpaF